MYHLNIAKILFFVIGFISLIFGIVGIFLPVLPTTPFLLLSAYCFARSSDKMYNWLMTNRYFGKYLSDYRAGLGIPLRIKIYAISLLWITILISIYLIVKMYIIKILLFLIALTVTIHIIKIKTRV